MPDFWGEYECTIDAKGRLRLPTSLLKDLELSDDKKFVINRGFEKCLMLYPIFFWQIIKKAVDQLNFFDENDRAFMRYFYRGASNIELDASDRMLIQKQLQEYAGLDKEVILFAYNNRIEIWDKATYDGVMDVPPSQFSATAQRVLGNAMKIIPAP
ncbi:MAG: division/cell wall cluster transcriptional repressor MraZ [Saprospiraceae bacterium]|nr:division/cell wall cluster transcriptional repressor MraZ [Saprospiraceae bacterium]